MNRDRVGATEDGARLGIASHVRAQALRVAIETSTADFARPDAPTLVALRERRRARIVVDDCNGVGESRGARSALGTVGDAGLRVDSVHAASP